MDLNLEVPSKPASPVVDQRERPGLGSWLWTPWYAKAWWAVAALFWGGKILSYWSDLLGNLYTTVVAAYLNVLLFPVAPALVLGMGFVLAWFDRSEPWAVESDEDLPFVTTGSGLHDPYSDSLDPKSGNLWVGHPSNIAQQFGRHWP
jgi:hypothetical protein